MRQHPAPRQPHVLVTMKTLSLPPLELLKEIFEISKDSPSGLIWKKPRSPRLKIGQTAGTKDNKGYWNISIKTDKNRLYKVHRIIYYIETGADPLNLEIDHINGNKTDNQIKNLRKATTNQNNANAKKRLIINKNKCSSVFKGVYWDKRRKKWHTQLSFKGKTKHIGYFKEEKEAAKAYNEAAIKYFGEFAKLNEIK